MGHGSRGPAVGAALAGLWLAVAVTVDLLTDSGIALASVFNVAPLIGCAVLPATGTALVGAVTLAAVAASAWWNDGWTAQQVVRVVDTALISVAAVVVAYVRLRREQQHARVVALAEVAQRAILPTLPSHLPLVATAARYEAAGRDALVGGDLYDSYHCDAFTRFVVGDVRGKGIGAVEQAARVIRAFRQSAAAAAGLAAVAEEMSTYLMPFLDDEEFVTALLVEVSQQTSLTIVSCGHPAPLLVAGSRSAYVDVPYGLPLGLGRSYDATVTPWRPGDRLLLYTDGLIEARDRHGRFLSLPELAPTLAGLTVDESLDELLAEMRRRLPHGRLNDDLALVLLENQTPVDLSAADSPMTTSAADRSH